MTEMTATLNDCRFQFQSTPKFGQINSLINLKDNQEINQVLNLKIQVFRIEGRKVRLSDLNMVEIVFEDLEGKSELVENETVKVSSFELHCFVNIHRDA